MAARPVHHHGMLDSLTQLTRQPEYLHTLLHPLPIWGLASGAVGLLIALFLRSRAAEIATLVIVLISSASAVPVYLLGGAAEDRVEGIVDDAGRQFRHREFRTGPPPAGSH